MKKMFAAFVFIVMVTPSAFAYAPGGFYDGITNTVDVKQALNLPDNSYVNLKGNITKRITSDEYLFTDKTATITVEIDAEKWLGQIIKPTDIVEISGEIDRDFRQIKIDVDSVKVVK